MKHYLKLVGGDWGHSAHGLPYLNRLTSNGHLGIALKASGWAFSYPPAVAIYLPLATGRETHKSHIYRFYT